MERQELTIERTRPVLEGLFVMNFSEKVIGCHYIVYIYFKAEFNLIVKFQGLEYALSSRKVLFYLLN